MGVRLSPSLLVDSLRRKIEAGNTVMWWPDGFDLFENCCRQIRCTQSVYNVELGGEKPQYQEALRKVAGL